MQSKSYITYQIATHHLSKIALRIETLFEQIDESIQSAHPMAHHLALLHTIELIKLSEKPELKSRFLKEFMKFDYTLSKQETPLPESLTTHLQERIYRLGHLTHRFNEKLLQDPLIQTVNVGLHQQHEIMFDAPLLQYWLEQPSQDRKADLNHWLDQLQLIYDTAKLYLTIIRHSAPFESIQISNGFYQQGMHEKRTCYLILVRLLKQIRLIPKIQVGHYGITIRLCDKGSFKEKNCPDVQFDLAICLMH